MAGQERYQGTSLGRTHAQPGKRDGLYRLKREFHCALCPPTQELSQYQAEHAVQLMPSALQYLSFIFGLGNLLSGPYLEYVDYHDFMEKKGVSAWIFNETTYREGQCWSSK